MTTASCLFKVSLKMWIVCVCVHVCVCAHVAFDFTTGKRGLVNKHVYSQCYYCACVCVCVCVALCSS